jgi:dystonin
LAENSQRFRVEDVPPRLHEKERISHEFRSIERFLQDSEERLDANLHPEAIDKNWNQLMMLYQERDQMIHDEIKR